MKTWGLVGVWLLFISTSCVDAGVGSDDCVGDAIRCRLPESLSSTQRDQQELSTRGVPEIPATWIRALPLPDGSDEMNIVLTSDLEGDVWLFATEAAGVAAMRLEADGDVAEHTTIAPPRDLHVTNASKSGLYPLQQSAVGPTISVSWFLGDLTAASSESIRLGSTIDDKLQRFALPAFQGGQTLWTADGSRYSLRYNEWVLEKYDRKGRLEWRQAALRKAWSTDDTQGWFGLTQDERVIVFQWDPGSYLTAYVVSENGNIVRYGSAPAYVTVDAFPTRNSPSAAVAAPDDDGDLYMWRVEPEEPDSVRFAGAVVRREDYLRLSLAASAMDSERTLYALTKTGSRDLADQRHMLCRVPVAGPASCVKLAATGALAVTDKNPPCEVAIDADGVVFLRVGTELARIDLPEP